ncbi:SAM-dependent methyltransferase [Saccharopolyspora sp. MS10]|uniref:SAM-dependent methyltransferase n=1 Tax=Saccharopolyspora sp. MS10 TaxID=3385973 RepID=UPI0039A0B4D2
MESFDSYRGAPGSEPDVPSAARIYDYDLGGDHHFAVDREAAERIHRALGSGPQVARDNRAFLRRAVRFGLDCGIDQFLDLGSGIPIAANVHEIAHERNPDARVAYVDNDPLAVARTRQLLTTWGLGDRVSIVDADVRDPDVVLAAPAVRDLDLGRPTALLMMAVLHHVGPEHDLAALVGRYTRQLAPGSVVALSHAAAEPGESASAGALAGAAAPAVLRTRAEIIALVASLGLDLVEPGVVQAADWRPDQEVEDPSRSRCWAAVAVV